MAEAEPYSDRFRAPLETLKAFLADVGARLESPVTGFLIGGCNMSLQGLKDATKDADLIVRTRAERQAIHDVMQPMGYELGGAGHFRELHPKEYAGFRADLWRKRGQVGLDVFERVVMEKFHLTPSMEARARQTLTFGNLNLRLCGNEDIFLFKAITYRPDDDQDVLLLAQTGLDVRAMQDELRLQPRRQGVPWPEHIVEQLRKLEARTGVDIPWKTQLDPW